jgi:hypothetical protein
MLLLLLVQDGCHLEVTPSALLGRTAVAASVTGSSIYCPTFPCLTGCSASNQACVLLFCLHVCCRMVATWRLHPVLC